MDEHFDNLSYSHEILEDTSTEAIIKEIDDFVHKRRQEAIDNYYIKMEILDMLVDKYVISPIPEEGLREVIEEITKERDRVTRAYWYVHLVLKEMLAAKQ